MSPAIAAVLLGLAVARVNESLQDYIPWNQKLRTKGFLSIVLSLAGAWWVLRSSATSTWVVAGLAGAGFSALVHAATSGLHRWRDWHQLQVMVQSDRTHFYGGGR